MTSLPIIETENEDRDNKLKTGQQKRLASASTIIGLDLLEEIADRLGNIERLIKSEHPTGLAPMETFSASGTELKAVFYYPVRKLKSVSIHNDGPNDVYIRINNKLEDKPSRIKKNEVLEVDMKIDIIDRIYFNCVEGESASGRIIGKL